jgi:lipopolysaccharide biosynthesis protein
MIKPIAFYLPQYHPIPENDEWWGKGFTEWTNVTKAQPLFKGHVQPRLPGDLGFYDLRVEETRIAQARLAKKYGFYGFAYWHYWFGNGKQILERPLNEVVATGKPDFPFCIAWANQTWSGTWHGLSTNKILIEQSYPGEVDYRNHFFKILPILRDTRYIRIEGKCLFMIFRTNEIPDLKGFTELWQKLAIENGLSGFHFVSCHDNDNSFLQLGIHSFIQKHPSRFLLHKPKSIYRKVYDKVMKKMGLNQKVEIEKVDYDRYVDQYPQYNLSENEFPMVFPDWDNSPRSGNKGWMFQNSSPEAFGRVVEKAIKIIKNQTSNKEQILIVKSWNEWAEGNYMEPDRIHGLKYLKTFKAEVDKDGK